MPEQPLRVSLEATDHRPGQFMLTFNSSQYSITLNPETNVTFSEWLRRIHPVLAGQKDPSGQLSPQELLWNVGTWLWQALLPDEAPAQERDSLAQALRKGDTPLLLALPDALAGLPWELLCDSQQPAEQGFLARRRPFMRLVPTDTSIAPVTPPLRVLLLISSPPGLGEDSRVDVESERAAVEQTIYEMREAGWLHLLVEDIVTPKRVQQALMRFKPHIVHYIGHGEFYEQAGGVLLWEDDQGNEFPLSAARLADILRPRNLHAVVLHACETGRNNARTDMRSVAGTLLHEGIPAVIAQQANFSYESSQRASEAWYTALTAGQGFAQALFEVRQALSQADRPDWAVPILQGSTASLVPVLDDTALPGRPDPLLKSLGAVADLPAPTGVFVGRHRELRELRLMLENTPGSGPALVMITGPGGVGKSSLAALAVARYGGKYKAAFTLSCRDYQDVGLFLKRMGEFLKGLEAPSFLEQTLPDPKLSTEAKIEKAVAALNKVGPVLLIVDNLENVQHDDQTLRDAFLLDLLRKLLTNLRGGRVLITGRYTVKDLLPQGKFAAHLLRLDLDDLSSYETNQLLTRHPTLAHLGETVRQTLIREFGGLPYVYDLLSRGAAGQSLELLIHDVQNRVTQERKQRSDKEWQVIRRRVVEFAALEATVSRLSAPSRALLAHLSVLQHSFPLAAIEQGLGAVPDVWQPLLDWSLLRYDPLKQTYHLHSITRHYAEDLLNETDRRQVQAQLAAWYERYAYRESHDLADFLEAHRLWRAAGNLQQAGELVMQLAEVLRRFGLYPLLRELCTTTLHDVHESDELLAAQALSELGTIAYVQGSYPEARQLSGQSLEIKERLGDQHGRAATLHQLGMIAQDQGDYPEARRLYGQSLEIDERVGNQGGQAKTLGQLGTIAYVQGSYPEARQLSGQSLEIKERLGDQHGRAATLHQLGMIARDQGDYPEARRLYGQSLEIDERVGDQRGQAYTLGELGNMAQDQGAYEEARRLYSQSLAIFERLGDQHGRATTLHQLGMIAQDQGAYEEARRLYEQSLAISERLGNQLEQAGTLQALGVIAKDQGTYEEARRLYEQSLAIAERLGDQRGQAKTLGQLGDMAQDQGAYEEARRLYEQSLAIFEGLGNQRGQVTILEQLGDMAQDQGAYEEARRLYRQSLAISERLGDQRRQAPILLQLGILAHQQEDYPEARRFYGQSLEIDERVGDQDGQAVTLHALGMIAQDQGAYEEARQLYSQSLAISEQLGNQRGQANTLGQLGDIAYFQGAYEEAQRLYEQCMAIKERLGDQHGQAAALGQLGMLAFEQHDFENALTNTVQAYILFDALHSPSRDLAQRLIARIQSHMDKATFTALWRTIAGDRPLPIFSNEETNQQLLQDVIDFMQAPTWDESKCFLESHLELLQPEVDPLLQQLATQQEHDSTRKIIEEHRLLLALCRDKGIDAAFTELQGAQNPEMTFAAGLNRICNEVVTTLRTGKAEQQEALVTRLEQILKGDLPIEGVQDFLQVLIGWLRGQDTHTLQEKLQPQLRDVYTRMVAAVGQEETEL